MKATFNNIVENLVKVFTDTAESAQYYSENEQYTGLCGWCGIMSPESRPAYIKTFGKDTTEAAEAKAREMIAEKEAAAELLLEAKGFSGCIVSVTDGSVDVVVNEAELSDAQRAQIEDIVMRKTEVAGENIVITPMDESM